LPFAFLPFAFRTDVFARRPPSETFSPIARNTIWPKERRRSQGRRSRPKGLDLERAADFGIVQGVMGEKGHYTTV